MKKLLLLLAFLGASLAASAQNYNFNIGGLQYSSGAAAPASCSRAGSYFFKNTSTKGWYICNGSTYDAMSTGVASGTVTSVGFTGGLVSVGTPTSTPAFTVAGTSGGIPFFSSTSTWATSALLTANSPILGGGAGTTPATATFLTTDGSHQLTVGIAGGGNGAICLAGNTSGCASFTAPATAGTATNRVIASNGFSSPDGTASSPTYGWTNNTNSGMFLAGGTRVGFSEFGTWNFGGSATGWVAASTLSMGFTAGGAAASADAAISRGAAGMIDVGTGAAQSTAGYLKTGNTVTLSADWTCGTGGTVSSCVAATIVGSTATPLTFTLPLVAANWHFACDLVVGQATAATSNQWNILTATNGVTSTTASYAMATAATVSAYGAVTDQASTTTTFQVTPSWTLGGTATKMPAHIAGTLTGASASGTVFSLQLVAPTVGDLVTIYEGSGCSIYP